MSVCNSLQSKVFLGGGPRAPSRLGAPQKAKGNTVLRVSKVNFLSWISIVVDESPP